MAQSSAHPTGDRSQVISGHVWQHSFVEIDHEIFSKVILSLPLIKREVVSTWQMNVHTSPSSSSTSSFSFFLPTK